MSKKKVFYALASFVLAMAFSFIVSYALGGSIGIIAVGISSVVMLIPVCIFIRIQNEEPAERLLLRLPEIKHFFAAVLIYIGASSVSSGVIYALYSVYYKNASSPDEQMFEYLSSAGSPFLLLLCIAVIPAIVEEMIFRGYIQTAFGTGRRRAIIAIGVSSLLFCIAHGSIYKAPGTLIIGIAFGYIAYKSGSVLITVILHFLNNATSLISYYTLKNSSDAAMSFIFKDSSNYFLAGFALALGILLIFLGSRIFAERKMALVYKLIPIVGSALVCVGCIYGIVLNETDKLYDKYANEPVSDAQIIEETITLDKNTLCIVNGVFNCRNGVDYSFALYDSEGKAVCDNPAEAAMLLLDKGEYTMRIEFSVEKGTEHTDTAYSVMILTFGEYSGSAS